MLLVCGCVLSVCVQIFAAGVFIITQGGKQLWAELTRL